MKSDVCVCVCVLLNTECIATLSLWLSKKRVPSKFLKIYLHIITLMIIDNMHDSLEEKW